jgi:hypothetical protein
MIYSTGIVYKIVCTLDSSIVYIGSTFNLLRQRWQEHKHQYKRYLEGEYSCVAIFPYFTKYGIENFKILKIKEYKCCRNDMRDTKHLHSFEQLWINKTKGCVNKQDAFSIPVVAKEKNKEYRKKNSERISEREKEYYENNKERIKEREKEYYENNKERKKERNKDYYENNKERNKEKVECEICKSRISKAALSNHKKSKKHILAMEKQE